MDMDNSAGIDCGSRGWAGFTFLALRPLELNPSESQFPYVYSEDDSNADLPLFSKN